MTSPVLQTTITSTAAYERMADRGYQRQSDDGAYQETRPDVVYRKNVEPYMYEPKAKRCRLNDENYDPNPGVSRQVSAILYCRLA